jgi:uncharacterized protein VirK/YbjX
MSRHVRAPGIWEGVRWALDPALQGGGTSRQRLAARALLATVSSGKALRRWMAVLAELRKREILRDLQGEYLRAIRPYVHRGTTVAQRVSQLTDHMDWLETAFEPPSFDTIVSGRPLVLLELTPPRGCEFMRLQLRHAPAQSPEGEMLLALTLQRSADVQHRAAPVDVAVVAFSRFRIDGTACMVIGGVRGQRDPMHRISAAELNQALHGWKPAVLLVRACQELARYWHLNLVGLDPAAHRLHGWTYRMSRRRRESGERVFASYRSLWDHFDARNGPPGWVIIPLDADEKLAATALSPEKRMRQTRRADYWIRTRNALRSQMRKLLHHPLRDAGAPRVTQAMANSGSMPLDEFDFGNTSDDPIPSHVLETGPGSIY